MSDSNENIVVIGAKVHNLKNVDVCIPRYKLTVVTGLSGSGKSSLAFDTIHAEGQRRYLETFSAYARQFLGGLERPNVDMISGLSPVISIEQKTTNKNPRSTVGTITEIYDYLRLLYARASDAYSFNTGKLMVKYTEEQILDIILNQHEGKKIYLLAPLIKGRKGHYKELFEQIRRKGYISARIDGNVEELKYGLKLDRYKVHSIEAVIDKLRVSVNDRKRLRDSMQHAFSIGKGEIMILVHESDEVHYFSKSLMCPESGISYNEPAPHSFSFNSPQGACSKCNGLGTINQIDIEKVIPDSSLSINKGAIVALGKYRSSLIFWQLEALAKKYGFDLNTPVRELSEELLNLIINGSGETFRIESETLGGTSNYFVSFEGVVNYISHQKTDFQSAKVQKWADQFLTRLECPECKGSRLKKEALFFKIADKNIAELASLNIYELRNWISNLDAKLSSKQRQIAGEIIKELSSRLSFLEDVGLEYLSLDRSARSLAGGESQRIRLATQIGSKLVNVLYILDEPSIGLHQRDNLRLIKSLEMLRDSGNTVIVVEHDREMIEASDYIIDIGPTAGKYGGRVVAQGTYKEILKNNTLTSDYLSGRKSIAIPSVRRPLEHGKLVLIGASGNNLKNISIGFPLGVFICITGVSGSGKSSLVIDTLQPILSQFFYKSRKNPLPYCEFIGIDMIDKVIEIDQSPLGKTPRSNPATYTGIFGEIRKVFEQLPESKIRGYKAGRFSFNVKGGRCEGCGGAGLKTIEMNFLPDVYVLCEDCNGRRYNSETLDVRYKGKSINEVLEMTIEEAEVFFRPIPSIYSKVRTLCEVGLGYVTLGQASTTLSGGEAQRVKLATELSKKDTGKTFYILDEPTTGLHFEDIKLLINVLQGLVDKGNTVLVIEHNMDVIKVADHIIDLGPEGGNKGGKLVFVGTPEELAQAPESYTGQFLKKELEKTLIPS